jgi:hypothetical protein
MDSIIIIIIIIIIITNFDTPRYLWSVLTAHHTAWNQPHIFQELDANIVVTEQKCNKQLIRNSFSAQCRTSICSWRYKWFSRNTFLVCRNNGRNRSIDHLLCPHSCTCIFLLRFHVSHTGVSHGRMPHPVLTCASVVVQLVTTLDGELGTVIWCCCVSRYKCCVYSFKKWKK